MAGEGQSIKHLIRTSIKTGEAQSWPTHKLCRKMLDK